MKKLLYLLLPVIFLLGLINSEVHKENLNIPMGTKIDGKSPSREDFISSYVFNNRQIQAQENSQSILGKADRGIGLNLVPYEKGYKKHPGNSEFIMYLPSSGGGREDCPDGPDGYVQDCADDDCCPSSWIGDGWCDGEDEAAGCNLCCYDNDGGDCSDSECPYDDSDDSDDSDGNDDEIEGCPDGYVDDCVGQDCCPLSWIGDGLCDGEDQPYGCDLTCYDNDGGDCDIDDPSDPEVVAEYTFSYDWGCNGNPGSSPLTLFDDYTCDIGGYPGVWGADFGTYSQPAGTCPGQELEVDLWFQFNDYEINYFYELVGALGSPGNGWHDDFEGNGYSIDGQSFLDGGFVEDTDHFTMDELAGEYDFIYQSCGYYDEPYSWDLTLYEDGTCDIQGYPGFWGVDLGPTYYSGGYCPGDELDVDLWFTYTAYSSVFAYDVTEDAIQGFHDPGGNFSIEGYTTLISRVDNIIEVGPGLSYNNIQDAIDDIDDGGEIIVHDGTYNESLLIEKDVYIHSLNGPDVTTISGDGTGSVIVMRPESQNSHIPQIVLNGFTIENGVGTSMDIDYGEEGIVRETLGGGVFVYNVAPTINNCIFDNNGNNRAGLQRGGGLFGSGASEDINFPVRDYICDAPPVSEPMDLSGNTFIGNSAEEGSSVYIEKFNNLSEPHDMSNGNYDVLNTTDTDRENSLSTHWANLIGSEINTEGSSGLVSAVVSDIWVDPVNGVDGGDGSQNNPFRTISHALPLIFPTSENPLIIHLSSGTYSPDSGESFPLQLHSYTSIVGAGEDISVIDPMGTSRVFTMENASNINLSHLTITGGMTDGLYPMNHGGGIRMRLCDDIAFDNITISDNRSKFGGGISAYFSELVIEDAVFDGNMAICEDANLDGECDYQGDVEDPFLGGGGAIFTAGLQHPSNTTLDRVTLTNNTSDIGGAFCSLSGDYLTLNEVDIYENTVGKNAAVYLNNVDNSSFDKVNVSNNTGCTAQSWSGIGGVFIGFIASNSGLHTLNRLAITNNEGGGIYLYNNYAPEDQSFTPILNNVTVSGNYGQEDWSGMLLWDTNPYIVNSILWDNDGLSAQLVNDADPIMNYSDIQGGWDGYGNMDWNPDFVNPENGDYSLQPTSACIDAGIADIDGDGYSDSDYVGDAPDMGAFEYPFEINILEGDLNFDETVNIIDILVLVNFVLDYAWVPYADFNNDGALDILDILILVNLVIEFGTD